MKVVLSGRHESANCVWCEKDKECVQATFSDGFVKDATICWKCLQQAFKVRSQQVAQPVAKASEASLASES